VTPGSELEFAGRVAGLLVVDCHARSCGNIDAQDAGQLEERDRELLVRRLRDLDLHLGGLVARLLGANAIVAGTQQHSISHVHGGQSAGHVHVGRSRIGAQADRRRRENEPQHGRGSCCDCNKCDLQRTQRDAARRLRGLGSAKTNRFDALGVAVALSAQPCARGDDRRRGDVAAAAIVDLDHGLAVALGNTQPRRTEIHDVAAAQPRGALYTHAVVQHFGAVGRLHEQLFLVQADEGFCARRPARHHDRAAGAADRDREIRGREAALTEGFANDQPAQMRSSQRITTGSDAAPGRTLISRRTSR
jgi:hypothetical protein